MPVPGYPDISRGSLRTAQRAPGELVTGWVRQFYHLFIGYLNDAGIDDVEDEEVICPSGMVPVMTMHQSKGLEFPFVFVGHAGAKASASATHQLEEMFDPYPSNPARAFGRAPADERAQLDLIRQYFVAYSRPAICLDSDGQHGTNKKKCQYSLWPFKKLACAPQHQYLNRSKTMAPWRRYTSVSVPPQTAAPIRPRFSLTSDIISYRKSRRTVWLFWKRRLCPCPDSASLLRHRDPSGLGPLSPTLLRLHFRVSGRNTSNRWRGGWLFW